MIVERIQDICHFLITFHTPISLSTPHIYISGRPFLPTQSPLSRIFSSEFIKAIKIRVGSQSSWPAPPVDWTGHAREIWTAVYSPNGARVVSGSGDRTIRIWDAESGAIIGEPLTGHNKGVNFVVYSPDGQHIVSGSEDCTIRIWDAETGAPIGDPLEGHSDWGQSLASSPNPNRRHIISGSDDSLIGTWDAEVHTAANKPFGEYIQSVQSIARSPDGEHIVSGSYHNTTRVLDAFPHPSIRPSSPISAHPGFRAMPNKDGWVEDSEGGLLYWVPHDYRKRVHSPAIMTIPLTSHKGTVSLDFDDFAFGTSWSQIFKGAPFKNLC